METKVMENTFMLPKKIILVQPVRRRGGWIPIGHEADFLFKHSYFSVVVPKLQSGMLKDPLTDEERDFFESTKSGMALKPGELSIYKKDNNYWNKFRVKLTKEVLRLDLSNPMDYIKYKVLLSNSDVIAPSSAEKFKKATYKFALVEEGQMDQDLVKSAKNKKEAYRAFGKMDNSPEKLKDFLGVYYTLKPGGKSIPVNAKLDFLIAETEKIIDADLETFLTILNDKDYETKIMINKAIRAKALEREKSVYRTPEGITIGENLNQAIAYLNNPLNSEEIIKIQTRIDTSKV